MVEAVWPLASQGVQQEVRMVWWRSLEWRGTGQLIKLMARVRKKECRRERDRERPRESERERERARESEREKRV